MELILTHTWYLYYIHYALRTIHYSDRNAPKWRHWGNKNEKKDNVYHCTLSKTLISCDQPYDRG